MTRKPSAHDWARLEELTAAGIVRDDDSLFALEVIQRFDPKRNDSLSDFYIWCRANSRSQRKNSGATELTYDPNGMDIRDDERLYNKQPDLVTRVVRYHFSEADLAFDAIDATIDLEGVRERVGKIGYLVLQLRHGDGLSVTQTAKRMGLSRESVQWIEKEAMARASSGCGADS